MPRPFREIAKEKIGEGKEFSYRQVEYQTGYNHSYINRIVTGKKPLPENTAFYEKMAKVFHMPPEEFKEYPRYKALEAIEEAPELANKILKLSEPKNLIPVLGYAPADNLRPNEELHLENVPQINGSDFAVIASGDCLTDAGILDGDIVYIKKQPTANKGELVLVRYDGDVTLKFFHPEKNRVRLVPANKKYKEIVVEDCEIIGVKVAVLRK